MTPWTSELDGRLRAMWKNNTATQIADALNKDGHSFSRNAVIGRINRLGLTQKLAGRPRVIEAPPVVAPVAHQVGAEASKIVHAIKRKQRAVLGVGAQAQAINRPPKIKPEPFVCQDAADIVPLRLSLFDLTDQTCKWPYGDQAPYEFCGHLPACGSPYCPGHTRIAIGQGTPAERAAHHVSRKVA